MTQDPEERQREASASGEGAVPSTRDGAVQTQALEARGQQASGERKPIFGLENVGVAYGGVPAVREVDLPIYQNEITALIGPSGCGKSTLIRCLNRMNDLIPAATVTGKVNYHGQDLYGSDIDPVQVRKRIGMVFQKPNPFPKSIYDNIAFCLLYTSDAADDLLCVDLGGRRIIKKKKKNN